MKLNKILLVSIFLSQNSSMISLTQVPKFIAPPLRRDLGIKQIASKSSLFDVTIEPEATPIVESSFAEPVAIPKQVFVAGQIQAKQQPSVKVDMPDDSGWQNFDENDLRWSQEIPQVDSMALNKQLELPKLSGSNIAAGQQANPRAQRIIAFKKELQQKPLKKDQDIDESVQEPSIQVGQKKIIQLEFDFSKNLLEKVIEQKINLNPTHQTFYTKTRNNFIKKYMASKDSPEQTQADLANANEMNDRAVNLPTKGRQIIVDVWADLQLQESNSKLSQVKKGYSKGKKYVSNKLRTLISKKPIDTVEMTETDVFQKEITNKIIKLRLDTVFGVDKYSSDSNGILSAEARNDLDAEITKYQNVLFNRDGKNYSEVQRKQAIANISDAVINKVTSGIAKFQTTMESDGTYSSEMSSDGLTSQTVFDPTGKAKSRTLSVLDENNKMMRFATSRNPKTGKVETAVFDEENSPILDKEGKPTVLTANGANQVEQWQASHLACVLAKSTLKAVLYGIKMTPYVAYWALTTPHDIKSIVIMLSIEISKTSIFTVVKAGSLAAGFEYQDPVVSSLTNRIGAALSGSNRGWMSAERGRIFKRGSETSNWLRKMQGEDPESMNPDEEYYTCLSLVDDMVGHLRPQENAYLYGAMSFDPFGSNSLAPKVSPAFSTEPVISPLHTQTLY